MRIVVAPVRDFAPGDRKIVTVGRRSIGVFRVGDSFYALSNRCPHQGGPLCLGRLAPWLASREPGDFRTGGESALLACPWHGWEYDIATGQSFLGPGETPVRSYDVGVEPGSSLDEETVQPDPGTGRIPGPYVAETFPVHVEEDYVVVETQRTQAR